MRKRIAAVSATLLTAATLIATATPAQAAPSNCRSGKSDVQGASGTFWYICTAGDGGYYFKYRVKHPNPQVDMWMYGYQTECAPVLTWLEFRYTIGQREITEIAYC
ncbi:hypothetical protein C1I98_16585 [Spongiactinospora gelatinilytica]|uniref:Secreted protein n=1 Tax=Spongiactinospora gelatinilytica TaxID=2666298 RepID=A0A2W2GXU5_9ACTN|nr:hypothetical protein [Spongiactinospora gelatinilytica]PZG44765.1 hypothetical protein C1I98_16585 [Spongiactinospora gelatinilytica]